MTGRRELVCMVDLLIYVLVATYQTVVFATARSDKPEI